MLSSDETPYNLRNKRNIKRKQIVSEEPIEKKRLRSFDHIGALPDEILLRIFSFLDVEDLYYNVRLVCQKWHRMAMLASPWTTVTASGNDVPTHILKNWIRSAPFIKHLKLSDRNDADAILANVVKYSSNLETITIENCWGSTVKVHLQSKTLCQLLSRCKKLGTINFERVRIRSCKFFRLLPKRRSNGKFLHLRYVGLLTIKQYNTLNESCSGEIFPEFIEMV